MTAETLTLDQWAILWGIPPQAVAHLRQTLAAQAMLDHSDDKRRSEAAVQSRVFFDAGQRGDIVTFRNNVGVLKDETGRPVRYGLANETPEMNKRVKSADTISIWRRVIQPQDVGSVIGQFVSVEVKEEGWKYTGRGREAGQSNWATLVRAYGGIAYFYSGGIHAPFAGLPRF